MHSFASANGPSTMLRLFGPSNLTFQPFDVGCSPERSSRTPALDSSSLHLPMVARISSLGICPASESFVAFTIIMNRMVVSSAGGEYLTGFYPHDAPGS